MCRLITLTVRHVHRLCSNVMDIASSYDKHTARRSARPSAAHICHGCNFYERKMDKYNVNDNGTTLNNNGLIYKIISGCDINVASLIAKCFVLLHT